VNKLLPFVALLAICCGGEHGDGGGNEPPPPPPTPDYEEQEPNDTFTDANFITLLPVFNPEDIGGYLTQPNDRDFYYFFLNLNLGDNEILVNFVVEMDPFIDPKLSLWQTIYDPLGVPTGDYQNLGLFVGVDGNLVVLDIPIPYHAFTNNDLFVVMEGYGFGNEEYTIDFWTE
jgi:hypothetical protein